ncbi:Bug family tripartite tricarboxylate transporter substrate binding protein [Bordetella petrii]|uniref:Bug family tripartite tricarboxylate transporter substrate binding protein n=1 Tax=Bordetella petrii TaxID=94624 RepID=UPI00372F8795
MRMRALSRVLAVFALAACAGAAAQAAEPATRLIVGFQAGGGLDSVARALADALNRDGGQKVIVENRPGASGIIAIDAVRNARDGDSVLVILPSGSITMTPHTNKHFKYDPRRDLAPVARLATYTLGIAVGPQTGAATLPDFLARARRSSALAAYGTAGVGLSPHYIGVQLASESGVNLVHVPYKGAGPAINDALGGQIPAVISTVPSLLPAARDQRLTLLATTGARRDPIAADVPTLAELGYEGLELEEWFGVLAPAATPPGTVARWNAAINRALESKALRDALASQGFAPAPASVSAFRDLVIADYEKWGNALRGTGDTFSN